MLPSNEMVNMHMVNRWTMHVHWMTCLSFLFWALVDELIRKPENLKLKFAVTRATINVKEYISTTTVAALWVGEFNNVYCSGLYHDVNRIPNSYTNKPIHTSITKAEHQALGNLSNDKDHIIVTAVRGVALVVMNKTEYIYKMWSPPTRQLSLSTSVQRHISNYLQRTH